MPKPISGCGASERDYGDSGADAHHETSPPMSRFACSQMVGRRREPNMEYQLGHRLSGATLSTSWVLPRVSFSADPGDHVARLTGMHRRLVSPFRHQSRRGDILTPADMESFLR